MIRVVSPVCIAIPRILRKGWKKFSKNTPADSLLVVGTFGHYHHSPLTPALSPSEGRGRKHRPPWPVYFTLRHCVSLTPGFSPVDGRAFGSKLFQQFVTRRQAVETAQA